MLNSTRIYRSFRDAAKELPPEERLAFWDAVMDYALDGIEPELTGSAKAVFIAIRPNIDSRNEAVENGQKGGRPVKKPGVSEEENRGFLETKTGGYEEPKTKAEAEADTEADAEENIPAGAAPAKKRKSKFGKYGHVLLTADEFKKLVKEFGIQTAEGCIAILDEGIEEKGYKYKNHALTLRKWPMEEYVRRRHGPAPKKNGFRDFPQRDQDYDALMAAARKQTSAKALMAGGGA